MTPKSDTIAAIMRINRSAPAEFLSQFSTDELSRYLERLTALRSTGPASDQRHEPTPDSPGAAALRSAVRSSQKDLPFRFTPEPTKV